MVFPDLSAPETQPHQPQSSSVPVAFVADRFVALLLDFLIFSPIVSLLIAGLVRQTKTFFLVDAQSSEGVVAAGLVVVAVIFSVTLLQSVFLYFWQATPGQLFLQLRVISYPVYRPKLSYAQCFFRALGWSGSFLLLAIPFLEILSHPYRRAFHDRASDTLVITLKKNHDDGPVPMESRFIASWMRMSFLFLALFAVIGFFRTYHGLHAGEFRMSGQTFTGLCKELPDGAALEGTARLDAALSLYMLNAVSAECLEKESDLALWGDPVNIQPLAYLAKFLLTEGKEQDKYFSKLCEDGGAPACSLARYLSEEGDKSELENADGKLWLTQVLQSEEAFAASDYVASLRLITSLQKQFFLREALEKRYVRSVWALHDLENSQAKSSGRLPASADSDSWVDDFKDRYEVP